MQLYKIIDRLRYIHKLIEQESTGNPEELAQLLHLSRSQLYNILDELKSYGADIAYSRTNRTFFYVNHFEMKIDISILSGEEEKKIFAGFFKEKAFSQILFDKLSVIFLSYKINC